MLPHTLPWFCLSFAAEDMDMSLQPPHHINWSKTWTDHGLRAPSKTNKPESNLLFFRQQTLYTPNLQVERRNVFISWQKIDK